MSDDVPAAGLRPSPPGRRLGAVLSRPLVLAPLAGGALAGTACLALGLFVVALPETSLSGLGATTQSTLTRLLEVAVSAGGGRLSGIIGVPGRGDVRIDLAIFPLLYTAVPLAATFVAARALAARTAAAPGWARIGAGAGAGVALAALGLVGALLVVLATDERAAPQPRLWSATVTLLWWGTIGGTAGAAVALRREPAGLPAWPLRLAGPVRAAAPLLATARTALAPLALVVAALAIVGTFVVAVQSIRGIGAAAGTGRGDAVALLDTVVAAPNQAIWTTALAAGVAFRPPLLGVRGALPSPVRDDRGVVDVRRGAVGRADLFAPEPDFRLLDYRGALSLGAFVALLALALVPIAGALAAGARLARRARATLPVRAAAVGALTGPVWAVALAFAAALAHRDPYAAPRLGDLVLVVGVGGAILGAVGGAIWAARGPFALPGLRTRA